MSNRAKPSPKNEQTTSCAEPRPSRDDAYRPDAPPDLPNQVESDLQGTAGILRFSPEVERRYLQVKRPAQVRHYVWTTLIGILLYDLFMVADFFMVPDIFGYIREIHFFVTFFGIATVYLVRRCLVPPEIVMILLLLLTGSAVYTSHSSHAADAVFIPFTIPLIAVFGNIVLPLPFWYAAAFSALSTTAVSLTIWTQPGLDRGARIFALLLEASMAVYTLIATYRIEGGERRAYLLTLREQLRGETLVDQNRELSELSETDQLTGIANRRVFDRNFEQLWREHQQSRTPLALLMIDIDHFKKLNDNHGHINGDLNLRKVADRLGNLMHAHQSLARYGGEEFAVLLEGEGAFCAEAVAERLRAEIEIMPALLAGSDCKPHPITISIGCAAVIPRADLAPAELFVAADRALYAAKREGRNCVRVQTLDASLPESRAKSTVPTAKNERRPKTSVAAAGLIG